MKRLNDIRPGEKLIRKNGEECELLEIGSDHCIRNYFFKGFCCHGAIMPLMFQNVIDYSDRLYITK
jgi:hypothetical protein